MRRLSKLPHAKRARHSLFLLGFFIIVLTGSASAQGRHALVIGIDQYARVSPLQNAINDANAISGALDQVNFQVTKIVDPGYGEFIDQVNRFFDSIIGADCAVFYFAGHGIQARGQNFLIPRDFGGHSEEELWTSAVPLDRVISSLANGQQKVSIVIVDACRNNPLSSSRDISFGSRGLAPVTPPIGSLIAYSADAGQIAIDGLAGQNNGLYTGTLKQFITQPGLRTEDIFNETRKQVFQASGGKQSPAEYSKLINTFYFRPAANQQNLPGATTPPKPHAGQAPAAPPAARRSAAISALRQYYDAVNRRDFGGAYGFLSTKFKSNRPAAQFREVFSSTLSIYPVRLDTLFTSGGRETIQVDLIVVDDDYQRTEWVGPVVMVQEGGTWKMETSRNLMKVGTVSLDTPLPGNGGKPNQHLAEQLVHNYYRAVNLREFDAAYGMLSSGFQSRRSVGRYREIFNSTLSTYLRDTRLISGGNTAAQVYVEVEVIDSRGIRSRWMGPIALVREAGGWKIDTMKGLKQRG